MFAVRGRTDYLPHLPYSDRGCLGVVDLHARRYDPADHVVYARAQQLALSVYAQADDARYERRLAHTRGQHPTKSMRDPNPSDLGALLGRLYDLFWHLAANHLSSLDDTM